MCSLAGFTEKGRWMAAWLLLALRPSLQDAACQKDRRYPLFVFVVSPLVTAHIVSKLHAWFSKTLQNPLNEIILNARIFKADYSFRAFFPPSFFHKPWFSIILASPYGLQSYREVLDNFIVSHTICFGRVYLRGDTMWFKILILFLFIGEYASLSTFL